MTFWGDGGGGDMRMVPLGSRVAILICKIITNIVAILALGQWCDNSAINVWNYNKLGKFMVLSIMVSHFTTIGSGGVSQTILMSESGMW
jgi:hypothetical protein